jgi:hypothetical protein
MKGGEKGRLGFQTWVRIFGMLHSLFICLRFVFTLSLSDSFIFLTLTRLVVVLKFINFRFALFTPPLGDFQ